jgi:hypothetical protein
MKNEKYKIEVSADYIEAARRVLTPESVARYAAGDMSVTDDAGHDMIAREAAIMVRDAME